MSDQTQHSTVKTSNLPDKCPMTGANLQACIGVFTFIFLPFSKANFACSSFIARILRCRSTYVRYHKINIG